MVEEIENRRTFLGPDEETVYYISPPSAEDIRGADWNYSKTYTNCLVEGITTQAEMLDILRSRGIIGDEFEQRAEELTSILNENILRLEAANSSDEKRDLSIEVANNREELFQWNQRLNGPMANTCEQMADDSRLEYLTSCMVRNEDDSRVWPTYDAFLKEKSQNLAVRARFEIMLYLQGLDSDFLEQTPEAKAIREVEAEVIKKADEAIKAAAAITEEEENKSDDKSTTTKKRKTTKKRAYKSRKNKK